MKTIYILILSLLSSTAFAQLSIGAQAGGTFTRLSFPNDDPTDDASEYRTGLMLGIPIELQLTNAIGIQVEGNFLQKGTRFDLDNTDEDAVYRLNYLEVPVLLKLGAANDQIGFAFLAGPTYSYALSGEQEAPNASIVTEFGTIELEGGVNDIDFEEDQIKRSDVNFLAGLQMQVPFGNSKFVVDGRYRLGITNIDDSDNDEFEARNRGFSVSAGILFGL